MKNEHICEFLKKHGLEKREDELLGAIEDGNWLNDEDVTAMENDLEEARAEIASLKQLLNTPETKDFIEGVRLEAAHQRWRWGDEHDMRKTAGEWFWTLGFLTQKAMVAAILGDFEKAKHHTISSAALLANWHRHITRFEKEGS